jgi:DNA adenine methylase
LAEFVGYTIERNNSSPTVYIEPFAGGAGVGLYLLFHEYVDRIILNDLDPGIAAFWRAVFQYPEELIELIRSTEITVEVWAEQRQVYQDLPADDVKLGFATFFLNRTNRSGILTARPIGGLQQTGKWGIEARFNREDLADRVARLSRYSNRVEVRSVNATDLLADDTLVNISPNVFIYADPPYLSKSGDLYLSNLTWEDHVDIAEKLAFRHDSWLVTYDHDERVLSGLYPGFRCAEYSLSHSAFRQHFGREYLIFSQTLTVGDLDSVGPHGASWVSERSRDGECRD